MKLDADPTLVYALGDYSVHRVLKAYKEIDSPYNTYEHTGLPPHPISNPGIDAIDAVLNPATTDCLYYLHDKNRVTHCAATYAEQEANIIQYLTN